MCIILRLILAENKNGHENLATLKCPTFGVHVPLYLPSASGEGTFQTRFLNNFINETCLVCYFIVSVETYSRYCPYCPRIHSRVRRFIELLKFSGGRYGVKICPYII